MRSCAVPETDALRPLGHSSAARGHQVKTSRLLVLSRSTAQERAARRFVCAGEGQPRDTCVEAMGEGKLVD